MAESDTPDLRTRALRERIRARAHGSAPPTPPPPTEPHEETEEEAKRRRSMPPFEREPAQQDNPAPPHPPQKSAASSYLWLGVLLAGFGLLALVFPFVSTLATTLFIGGLFVAAGLLKLYAAFSRRTSAACTAAKTAWSLAYILGGGLLLYAPLAGAWSLTIVLASLFVVGGIASIAWALSPPKPPGWAWMTASGAISIALGGLVLLALPTAAIWFPGVVAGVDLLTTGAAFLAMDRAVRARR